MYIVNAKNVFLKFTKKLVIEMVEYVHVVFNEQTSTLSSRIQFLSNAKH